MDMRSDARRSERAAGVRPLAGCVLLAVAGCMTAPAPAPPPEPPPIPPPQVMVLLDEQATNGQAAVMSEALAVPLLLDRRVTVVDAGTVQANRDRLRALLIQEGDEQGALMAGLQLGADVGIGGTVETKRLAGQLAGSNLKSYLGTVTLRAVCTVDARLLATATDAATAIALDDATGTAKTLRLALAAALDKAKIVDADGNAIDQPLVQPIPADMQARVAEAREQLLDEICETDDELLLQRLDGLEPDPEALRAGLALLDGSDQRRALSALRVPSLWLAGRRDRLVDPRAMRAAAALAPGADVVVVEHAGHAPFLTHADVVADALDRFAAAAAEGGA